MFLILKESGVAFDLNRNYNIMINEEDHIRMQCLDSGFKPQELWESINSTDDILGENRSHLIREEDF